MRGKFRLTEEQVLTLTWISEDIARIQHDIEDKRGGKRIASKLDRVSSVLYGILWDKEGIVE